jgi:formate hydrogenlyase subunit 6/NADH:ubiquinone oxidoreductase subunit I
LKRLDKNEELCIACHACEEVCSKAFFKESNLEKACLRIIEGEKVKIINCTQCGVCIDICPVEALSRGSNGVVRINKKDCVGCLMCVGFCPEEAFFQHDDHVEPFKCIACGLCVKACPTDAIFIKQ